MIGRYEHSGVRVFSQEAINQRSVFSGRDDLLQDTTLANRSLVRPAYVKSYDRSVGHLRLVETLDLVEDDRFDSDITGDETVRSYPLPASPLRVEADFVLEPVARVGGDAFRLMVVEPQDLASP